MTEIYRFVLERHAVVPGIIVGILIFGDLVHFHSHLHETAKDGVPAPHDTFDCLPRGITELLLKTWQTRIFKSLVAADKILLNGSTLKIDRRRS